jgi:hypothetical protein
MERVSTLIRWTIATLGSLLAWQSLYRLVARFGSSLWYVQLLLSHLR